MVTNGKKCEWVGEKINFNSMIKKISKEFMVKGWDKRILLMR